MSLPSWRAQQSLVILSEAVISFLTLFLIKSGVAEVRILGLFALLYLGGGLMVRLHLSRILHPMIVPAGLAALAAAGALISIVTPHPEAIVLAAIGVLTLKDLATSGAVGDVHRAADRIGMPPTRLVTTGMLIGALLMIAVLWGGAQVLTFSPALWIGLVAAAATSVLYLLLRGSIEIRRSKSRVVIPRDVRLTCTLSMVYNAVSFVGKRFLLPIAVAHAALTLNLGPDTYTSLGLILSLLVLLGLATRGLSGKMANPRVMMYGGFFSGLSLWGILSASIAFLEMTWGLALFAVGLLLMIEITAKVWTLGFIEVLRLEARRPDSPDKHNTELAYFGYFMEMKCYGASIGFLVAVGALLLQLSVIGPSVVLGVGLGVWVLSQTRVSNIKPSPALPV